MGITPPPGPPLPSDESKPRGPWTMSRCVVCDALNPIGRSVLCRRCGAPNSVRFFNVPNQTTRTADVTTRPYPHRPETLSLLDAIPRDRWVDRSELHRLAYARGISRASVSARVTFLVQTGDLLERRDDPGGYAVRFNPASTRELPQPTEDR